MCNREVMAELLSNLMERSGIERSFSEWSVCPDKVESRW